MDCAALFDDLNVARTSVVVGLIADMVADFDE